jgi:hypothetical protein
VPTGWDQTLRILKESPNRAAQDLLAQIVLHGPTPAGESALELVIQRKDRRALQRLVRHLERLDSPSRAKLASLGEELGFAIREAYLNENDQPYQNACELILDLPAYDQLPLVLGSLHHDSARRHDAERLVRTLGEKLAGELDGEESARSRADIDRVRQQFLESLEPALARFAHHKMAVIPETILLLADVDSPLVKKILMEPTHTCHGPMIDAIRDRQEDRFGRWLLAALRWKQTPPAILQVIAHRRDAWFRHMFLISMSSLADPVVAHSIRQIRGFSWTGPKVLPIRSLSADEQRHLIMLISASGVPLEQKLDVIARVLAEGTAAARPAAACALFSLTGSGANGLVIQCIHDHDPMVQVAGLELARFKHLPHLLPILIDKLDHPNDAVRQAAKAGLIEEYNFERYTRSFDQLDSKSQVSIGQLLSKIDPSLFDELRGYMMTDHRSHRIRGARIVQVMDWGDHFWEDLLVLINDDDLIVRRTSLLALKTVQSQRFLDYLDSLTEPNAKAITRATVELLVHLSEGASSSSIRNKAQQLLEHGNLAAASSHG